LAMVQYMAKKNNPEYSKEELLQWGEVMKKVMKVNLQPYLDFKDLAENGTPDCSMVEKVDGKVKEIEQRRDLKQATLRVPLTLHNVTQLQPNLNLRLRV